jgi:hypothetical protein
MASRGVLFGFQCRFTATSPLKTGLLRHLVKMAGLREEGLD